MIKIKSALLLKLVRKIFKLLKLKLLLAEKKKGRNLLKNGHVHFRDSQFKKVDSFMRVGLVKNTPRLS